MDTTHQPTRPAVRAWTAGLFALGVVLVAAGAAVLRLQPPLEYRGLVSDFDQPALADVRALSVEPRPRGSPPHLAAREYLVSRLTRLGWQVEQWRGWALPPWQKSGPPLEVINIVATLPATVEVLPPARAGRLLLMAHYDSKRHSPGAGDDASGVAAVLHAAGALSRLAERRNEAMILLSDGEEEGLLGAVAFFRDQIDPSSIDVAINFEGRGSHGPVVLFETSGSERWLIDLYAGVSPRPVTSSLAADLYRIMPNATDFTVSRRAGVPGLNFAFIGGWINYHKPTDTVANLGRATLRHHLVQAAALSTALIDADLAAARAEERMVFFDVLSWFVIRYPAIYASGMSIAAAMALVGVLVWGIVSERLRGRQVLLATAALLGVLLVNTLAAWGVVRVVPGAEMMRTESLASLGFVLLALSGFATIDGLLTRHVTTAELSSAGLLIAATVGIVTGTVLRGGSYLLLLPTVLGSGALALMVWRCPSARHPLPLLATLVWIGAMVVVAAGPVHLVHLATVPNVVPPWNPVIPTAPVATLLTTLLLIAIAPLVRLLSVELRWVLPTLAAIGAAASFLIATAPWSA